MKQRRKSRVVIEGFDRGYYVNQEDVDKVTWWILRIIFKLGTGKVFIDKYGDFHKDDLAYFLGVGKYIEMDGNDYNRDEVMKYLRSRYHVLEKQAPFAGSKILEKNIGQISKLMELNRYEEQLLEFAILHDQYEILESATEMLGSSLNAQQVKKILAKILEIPFGEIQAAFRPDSRLVRSSILVIDKSMTHFLKSKLELLSSEFADNMLNLDEDISVMIKDSVRPTDRGMLELEDYEHLRDDIDILLPYLRQAIARKEHGVNILLYGLPGTGKTELVRTISTALQTRLFEISYADEYDEAIDGYKRLKAYKTAQSLLANQNILLMYDEAEDIFESRKGMFISKRQENKAWLNRILESNTIPTIWITNNIHTIDNAIIRRFDVTLEVPIPNKSKRAKIIRDYSDNLLNDRTIKVLAEDPNIAPALITRATRVVGSIEVADTSLAFIQLINNTLKAQGYSQIQEHRESTLPGTYDPGYINAAADLQTLTDGIRQHPNARLCLYGPAGTGKSAFGRYIAQTLDRPLLLKKGSDLISMWVGGTEKNIAAAFTEAQEENAVLVFDEVDSFLADRTTARQSWEVTQVNEMLVQMENFEGVFIATTNLMDNLDRASLRRFDLKLEFGYLKPKQGWRMFQAHCDDLGLSKPTTTHKEAIRHLRFVTPGDFAAVVRQHRFRPIRDAADLIARLEDEVAVKQIPDGKVMGFLA